MCYSAILKFESLDGSNATLLSISKVFSGLSIGDKFTELKCLFISLLLSVMDFLWLQHKLLTMSSGRNQEKINKLFETFTNADKSQAQLFEEINKELEAFLSKENNEKDLTDGMFDFLGQISDSVQAEFHELLNGDSNKKRFVRALSKMFAYTKLDTVKKIKRIMKIAIETTLKLWQGPRQEPARRAVKQRMIKPFKIKEILPQQKIIDIKKNGQIIKTINVRRKSRYFSGKNRLIFKSYF